MNSQADLVFQSLSDPTRRRLYEHLAATGEQTVRMLTDFAGTSQPTVSNHLSLLKRAGLVTDRHAGRQTHYSATPDGLKPLAGWLSVYAPFWENRLDDLEDLLKRMDQ
jgi:DNA-binding transcriptional ArsR family regulator